MLWQYHGNGVDKFPVQILLIGGQCPPMCLLLHPEIQICNCHYHLPCRRAQYISKWHLPMLVFIWCSLALSLQRRTTSESLLETLLPRSRNGAHYHNCAVQRVQQDGVSKSISRAESISWRKRFEFCVGIKLDPDLSRVVNPITYLQVIAYWVHVGKLVSGGTSTRKYTTKRYIQDVAQSFSGVGDQNPRLYHLDILKFRLRRQLCAYSCANPPPQCARYLPIHVPCKC